MSNTVPVPRYTYEDYAQWKEDWELIGGYPYQLLPSAKWKHNHVQVNLIYQAKNEIKNNCNCFVFTELDWKIDKENVVRPDLMIVFGEMKSDYLEFPPVLIVEVISQSSVQKDRTIKFELYQEQGVKYYLMTDYTKETVEVFQLIDNKYRSIEINQFVLTNNYTIEFDFTTIFKK